MEEVLWMSFGVEGDWKLLKGHAPNIRNAIRCCWSCSQLLAKTLPTRLKTESVAKSISNEQVIDFHFTLSLSVTNILLSS